MEKMEIELTEEQLKKVEILKSENISIGDAIDLLFEVKEEISNQIEDKDLIEKMNEAGFDLSNKTENLKKNFGDAETYDRTAHDAKHGLKWSKFFKF
ncbi:hypothetical protein [Methanobrevibacter sp.]|uniref:hypothetical protein n=1 Tax=Methanobrevibacter sp. TaxID=66852 RepID=UPI00388F2CAE